MAVFENGNKIESRIAQISGTILFSRAIINRRMVNTTEIMNLELKKHSK